MSNTIITSLNDITMSSKLLEFSTPNGNVVVDIHKLLTADGEDAYFNATETARLFKKDIKQFSRLDSTKSYIEILNDERFKMDTESVPIKIVRRGKETPTNKGTFGTFYHKDFALYFFRWLDPRFSVGCDLFLKEIIARCKVLKLERDNTKILFKDLTKTIKKIYIPAQTSDNDKKFAYSNLSGLVNIKVLGSTATKYAKDNSIEVEQGKSVRDYLSKEQLEEIEEYERVMSGLIEFRGITDYEGLKELLNENNRSKI